MSQIRTFLIRMSLFTFLHAAGTQRTGDTQLDPKPLTSGSYGLLDVNSGGGELI